jgi:glycosyltransferase involved in cell wall biosynthesis
MMEQYIHRCDDQDLGWAVGLIVPAHNEEDLLERCLDSLLAVEHNGPTSIVVVADDCTDNTSKLARSILGHRGVVINVRWRNVGRARGLGSSEVIRVLRTRYPSRRVWLANTDADSCVAPNWLTQQLRYARDGFHAVAGVVDVDSFEDFPPGFARRFGDSYGTGLAGFHNHVQSTNFGVSALAYEAVGGWPPLTNGEDRELWNLLRTQGFAVTSDRSIRVLTSGRSRGRVSGGFADSLCILAQEVA